MSVIRILHLSDLHFGDFNRFAGRDPRQLGKAFAADLETARKQIEDVGQVDLVVVSGDVAERGKPKEFEAGRAFLEALAGELGVLPRRFVFVPGNHDVSWPECKKVEADQETEDFDAAELRRRTAAVKLKHYDEFLNRFYGTDSPALIALKRGGQLYNLPELRLSVGALNSCERETHKVHGGLVSQEQAQSLLDAWREEPFRDWLKVVVVHHNPDLTTQNNLDWWIAKLKKDGLTDTSLVEAYFSDICGFEGAKELKDLVADARVQLVLHGHQHADDRRPWLWRSPGQALVLSTGSLGLSEKHLPQDEPLSCRLIRLDTEVREIDARRLVFTGWARTEGHLYRGAFTLDAAEPDGLRQSWYLPAAWGLPDGGVRKMSAGAAAPDITDLLKVYRDRMTNAWSSWSIIGVAQGVGSGGPLEGRLDDMYVELRFAPEFGPQKTDRSRPILARDLVKQKTPLLLRGSAGTGKTTWVRRTFRRLLEDERFVPILLVLRDLSRNWQGADPAKGPDRSIDAFLDQALAAEVGKGWAPRVGELLRVAKGPRPVLLVDGWDEIGELGEEVRRKLVGLMMVLPRLLVIVTSRPYGKDKPSHAEGFETLDVQPLSDSEMNDLGARFFRLCHPQDVSAARKKAERFETALAAAPEARGLARTPLFLTMMLMIGRAKPLPNKRHLLYEACIDNLLQAIPEKREREGATLLEVQWRPDDSQERWRVVARLAFEVQSQGFEEAGRGAIVRSEDELVMMLPPEWRIRDRRRFLAWLAGPAGILTDRTDGSYQFSHLSFQEFLAAWHLDSTREGADRPRAFVEFAAYEAWWETIQLWAALIDRKNPQLLNEPLAALLDIVGGAGISLAGMILADDSASVEALEKWARSLACTLDRPAGMVRCLEAWSASAQKEKKELLIKTLIAEGNNSSWAGWYRAEVLCRSCGREELPALPAHRVVSRAAIEQVEMRNGWVWSAAHLAASRLHWSRGPLWPLQPALAGLLNLWPNPRRWLGAHLQSLLINCPSIRLQCLRLDVFARRAEFIEGVFFFGSDFASYFASYFGRNFASYLASDLGRYSRHYLAHYFALYLESDLARYLASDLARYLASDFARYLTSNSARHLVSDFARYLAREGVREGVHNFARRLGLETSTPGFFGFAEMELVSVGRAAARFAMAVLNPEKETGIARLFCLAARLSGQPNADPRPFESALAEIGPTLPDIWPALAKHISRRSTPADRALLLDYAEHPEKAGEPLCWGLQFFVRGDVMLEDGSIVTLDELFANSGLPPLPLLEDMPPELV